MTDSNGPVTGLIPHPSHVTFKWIDVTPEEARLLLDQNDENWRSKPSDNHVERLCGELVRGDWKLSNDCVVFSPGGKVLNGGHRLTAIARSEIPATLPALYGLTAEEAAIFDSGLPRRLHQWLTSRGHSHAMLLGSLVNLYWRFVGDKRRGPTAAGGGGSTPTSETQRVMESQPDMQETVDLLMSMNPPSFIAKSFVAFTHYMLWKSTEDRELADEWMKKLVTGAGLTDNCPTWRARERLVASKSSKDKLKPIAVMNMLIRCANDYAKGKTWLRAETGRIGGKLPEFVTRMDLIRLRAG